MNTNNENPGVGRAFELAVIKWFENEYGKAFKHNGVFEIGNPPKAHRFDVVSEDKTVVAECKCYTWTETGNMPSAKMGFVNEAVFYLSFIPNADTYIVMKKAQHPRRKETLAEYYYRTYRHLLGNTRVLEFDAEEKATREIRL